MMMVCLHLKMQRYYIPFFFNYFLFFNFILYFTDIMSDLFFTILTFHITKYFKIFLSNYACLLIYVTSIREYII